jgi:hypothetical protein
VTCRLVAGLLLALVALAGAAQLAACGGAASDPFTGTWWEPKTGLRVQVKHGGDGYEVLVGTDLSASPATRDGDKLVVDHPERGTVELTPASGDRLQLTEAGKTSLLERAPQHQ